MYGAVPAAVSRPICSGVAPSSRAAASGSARTVTSLPIAEIAYAENSRRKSRVRRAARTSTAARAARRLLRGLRQGLRALGRRSSCP